MVPDAFADVLRSPDVRGEILEDDGTFPNNEALPMLLYRTALRPGVRRPGRALERVFSAHAWTGAWENGIFSYHHYHSTTHEVLGVAEGRATVQMGGPEGLALDISAGDVLIIPAGVAHKNLGSDAAFRVIGAYPNGRRWDLKTGDPDDRPAADENIEQVPLPETDPLYGAMGPIHERWVRSGSANQ